MVFALCVVRCVWVYFAVAAASVALLLTKHSTSGRLAGHYLTTTPLYHGTATSTMVQYTIGGE